MRAVSEILTEKADPGSKQVAASMQTANKMIDGGPLWRPFYLMKEKEPPEVTRRL